jgi:ArsR family metal-binding transcriptional regulator
MEKRHWLMLVKSYRKEFVLPPNPKARHLRCYAYLDVDISGVLPYLNTVLRGHQYSAAPVSLTLKLPGKLVTLYAQMIAINILKDEAEADSVLEWLKQEINHTWKNRAEIKPSFLVPPRPHILDILRLLPRTNCQECGEPTCMVFASRVSDGISPPDACPMLAENAKRRLQDYLGSYQQPY